MKAASLLLVFLLAKSAIVWGHSVPVTLAAFAAYAWQDAAVALLFGAFEILSPPRFTRALYWAAALYAAINIPVGRAVFTPLTRPMLRAARGPLADSMLQYVTLSNILLVAGVLAAAAILPRIIPRGTLPAALACAFALVLLGPHAARSVDTRGLDRNVLTALLGSHLPGAPISAAPGAFRQTLFRTVAPPEDLSRFAAAARGFNVVMVSLESTAAQYLGLYGAPVDAMPNLTTLARHSLLFENAYAVYPESIKGLFSVLCSRFPAFDSRPEQYESASCSSLASILDGAGYRTAMFHSGRFGYLGMESIIRGRGYQVLEDAGDIGGNHESSFGVDEPATVTRMLAWIDSLPRGQRFFLTYLPIAGHHPYATPEAGPFPVAAEVDQYRNALHYGDASLGDFIAGLRARGLERNTVWIIYGDHGEAFHQHDGNYGHTFFLYDENVRVPLLVASPGLFATSQRVRKVVSLVDVAPTVLDLMGIPVPAGYQGRTALDAAQSMALFFADYSLGLLGLRDGPWKFVQEIGSGRTELYDLDRDPAERRNLSAGEPARVAWYGQVVRGWSATQAARFAYRPTSTKAPQ